MARIVVEQDLSVTAHLPDGSSQFLGQPDVAAVARSAEVPFARAYVQVKTQVLRWLLTEQVMSGDIVVTPDGVLSVMPGVSDAPPRDTSRAYGLPGATA